MGGDGRGREKTGGINSELNATLNTQHSTLNVEVKKQRAAGFRHFVES
jgi:hypothetical protein